ncbi:MAG: alpha/beta hydrolase [Rhodobacteraceae bacterium]|nr:alpha/beta hydrolase [Paracoccaceae bacterium]
MERRGFLAATALAAAGGTARAATGRKPIVLVHGAGHGGWCWRDVRNLLRADGFDVYTPTMTGLGERVHLRSPDITLQTHITDIINVLEFEDLRDVVLVGHSYAGMQVAGVCDALKDRIAHAIVIDGAIAKDGEPAFPGMTMDDVVKRFGPLKDGYLLKMNIAGLGFPDPTTETAQWLQRHLVEHLAQVWVQPISLPNGGTDGVPRTYVQCADPAKMSPVGQAKVAGVKNDPTWRYIEKVGPHNVMMTDPEWTANLIREAAA